MTMKALADDGLGPEANLQILVSRRRVSKQRRCRIGNQRLFESMKLDLLASANLGSSRLISAVPEQSPGVVASELLDLLRAMS